MEIKEVIEDTHKYLGKKIKLNEAHLFCEPIRKWSDAQGIEDWLLKIKKPYVLAEIEMTNDGFHGTQYIRGYGFFVEKEEEL